MTVLPPREASASIVDCGGGFLPGEEVAAAISAGHLTAGPDGCLDAAGLIELLEDRPFGVIILVGRVSGTLVMGPDR